MLPHWKHLTLEQRVEIAHGLAHGEPLKSIAERIGLDPTSVSKEIRRNRTQETDDPAFRKPLLDRFLLKGREGRVIRVDYLVYGTPESFIFVSREDVEKTFPFLLHKKGRGLCFGPMTFQPYLRKSYWSKARKDNDHYQVKWHGMVFDFEYIRFGAKDD